MRFDLEQEIEKKYLPRFSWGRLIGGNLSVIVSFIDYCRSDNKLEGQEYAREFAASLYSGVIKELRDSVKEIDATDDRDESKFNKHIEILRMEYNEYKKANELLSHKISQALSRMDDSYYKKINLCDGTSITAALGHCIMKNDRYYIRIRESLDDKMEKKRKKYFLMEIDKCISNCEKIISELEKEREEKLNRYKGYKAYRSQKINELSDIVKQERNKYTNNLAKYRIICIRESR